MNLLQSIGALGLASLCLSCSQTATNEVKVPAIDLTAMDTTISPTADFYRYANGGWMAANPLPAAYSRYGSFDILRDSSRAQIHAIVEELIATKPTDKASNEYRVATLYGQAMDSTTRNKLGAEPIKPYLREVEALQDKAQVISYAAKQDQKYGDGTLFSSYVFTDMKNSNINIFHLGQTGLALGTRDYYIEDNDAMRTIRAGYITYLERIAQLAGYSETDAKRIAANTLKLETELAQFAYSQTELRDNLRNYNITNIADFASVNKGFDWQGYFNERGLKIETANFAQLDFFTAYDKWFAKVSIDELRDYLLASVLRGGANALDDKFNDASFDFYGRIIGGKKEQKPRWERSVAVVENVLGEALSQVYVKKHFSPKAKERMLTLVGNLQKALGQRVASLTWMSDSTKAKAQEKLQNFTVKIGYPDKWEDYSGLDIDASKTYFENLLSAQAFAQAKNMRDLGQPVDKAKWLMNAHEVNAYYMPTTNEICFPAGILQPPFFNVDADDAVNYGAIGVVIGHEMIHGFDDQGSNFDVNGNMINWWTPQDAEKFALTTKRLAVQFGANEVAPGVMANGELTLGENIADQGGLTIALAALKLAGGDTSAPIDKLTPIQRFFIAYARLWGQNINEQEILRLTKIDPHSLGELRVNQALKNIDAFHEAFGTKPGDAMYLAPEERIIVW